MRLKNKQRIVIWLIIIWTIGCKTQSDSVDMTQDDSTETLLMDLEWNFEDEPEEREIIASLIRVATESTNGPRAGTLGVIYRFDGNSANEKRYLLFTSLPNEEEGLEIERTVIFVLQEEIPKVSPPIPTGYWTLEGWGPWKRMDYDNDGWTDVAFCDWEPGEENRDKSPLVYGFRDGEWYVIPNPSGVLPNCNVEIG